MTNDHFFLNTEMNTSIPSYFLAGKKNEKWKFEAHFNSCLLALAPSTAVHQYNLQWCWRCCKGCQWAPHKQPIKTCLSHHFAVLLYFLEGHWFDPLGIPPLHQLGKSLPLCHVRLYCQMLGNIWEVGRFDELQASLASLLQRSSWGKYSSQWVRGLYHQLFVFGGFFQCEQVFSLGVGCQISEHGLQPEASNALFKGSKDKTKCPQRLYTSESTHSSHFVLACIP